MVDIGLCSYIIWAWTEEKETRVCAPIFNFGELDSELPEVKTMNI